MKVPYVKKSTGLPTDTVTTDETGFNKSLLDECVPIQKAFQNLKNKPSLPHPDPLENILQQFTTEKTKGILLEVSKAPLEAREKAILFEFRKFVVEYQIAYKGIRNQTIIDERVREREDRELELRAESEPEISLKPKSAQYYASMQSSYAYEDLICSGLNSLQLFVTGIKAICTGMATVCDEIESHFDNYEYSKILDLLDARSTNHSDTEGAFKPSPESKNEDIKQRTDPPQEKDDNLKSSVLPQDNVPIPSNEGKGGRVKSEFERNYDRLIEGSVERQYNGEILSKATIDGKVIVFPKGKLGLVAKEVFQGIVDNDGNAFAMSDVEETLRNHGNNSSNAKHVIAMLEAAIINAKFGQLFKGPEKPKAFIHDPSRSQPGRQQYITKLTFE